MDIGSEDRLALQNQPIPAGSTNRTIPEWLFPRRFPFKQRLTSSRPNAILVNEMPTKKQEKTNVHPRYALRCRTGCGGNRGLSATAPAFIQSPGPQSAPTQSAAHPSCGGQVLSHCYRYGTGEDTRPRSQLEAAHHQHGMLCQQLR